MAEFKIVYGLKDGKSVQQEYKEAKADFFLGKKLGEKFSGNDLGLKGYELQITGGSDKCGFPMRRDVEGVKRSRILAVKGVGIKQKRKGQKQRKTVFGNTISENISQINVRVLKSGKGAIGAEAAEAPADKGSAEKPAE